LDSIANNWKSEEWQKSVEAYYKDDPLEGRLQKYGVSSEMCHCAQLLNSFIHHGPNGKHFVMVFEILGVNFLEIIKRYEYKGVPIPLVRRLAKQCLIGLDYMHRICKLIHTDFKPENVVICLTDEQVKEIASSGQLTTTKMTGSMSHNKWLNMKVAGTLEPNEKKQNHTETKRPPLPEMEGLTAKQKKNMRKKMQKKRRKEEKGQELASEAPSEEMNPTSVMQDISNSHNPGAPKHPKKRVINGSMDMAAAGGANFLNGMLMADEFQARQQEELMKNLEKNKRRGPKIDKDVRVKICDMGNGCWTYHHFTPEIQTRQYRSPEVIIGGDYDTAADVWSFACTIFEMVTGDFLFEPRNGQGYDKDDDHLAQMMELLGQMPKNMALSGKHSKKYFNSQGRLRRIQGLNYWPLQKVLTEKYRIKEEEAAAFAEFLMPMLAWYPEKRATAQEMLKHPWFNMEDNYDYKYSEREFEVLMLKKQLKE